jgi:hypothetical protein
MAAVKRQARDDGDPVIAFLAKLGDVAIAQLLERRRRKLALRAFGLLKAEDVWGVLLQKAHNRSNAQADRINVPGGNFQFHRNDLPQRSRSLQLLRSGLLTGFAQE